jgi:hypothetical protein
MDTMRYSESFIIHGSPRELFTSSWRHGLCSHLYACNSRMGGRIFVKSGMDVGHWRLLWTSRPMFGISRSHRVERPNCWGGRIALHPWSSCCKFPMTSSVSDHTTYSYCYMSVGTWTIWCHAHQKTDDVISRYHLPVIVLHSLCGLTTKHVLNWYVAQVMSEKRLSLFKEGKYWALRFPLKPKLV